jgi:hypothetical protein
MESPGVFASPRRAAPGFELSSGCNAQVSDLSLQTIPPGDYFLCRLECGLMVAGSAVCSAQSRSVHSCSQGRSQLVDKLLKRSTCQKAATAGNQAMARVPSRFFWLQWVPNKQLPNVLLEGASPIWTRLFFSLARHPSRAAAGRHAEPLIRRAHGLHAASPRCNHVR